MQKLRFKNSTVDLATGEIELIYLDDKGNSHSYLYNMDYAKEQVERLAPLIERYNNFQR